MAETEPLPTAAPKADQPDVKALIAKHHAQIDRIKGLEPAGQMEAFRQLGVSPQALEAHYAYLQQKGAELTRQDAAAGTKTTMAGWVSLIAGFAVTAALRKKISDSKLIQGFAVGLTALGAGLAGTFVGSRLFAGKIREESRLLTIESRDAFERELAFALENKERQGILPAATPGQIAAVTPRDPSFAAQAQAEKAQQPQGIQRS
jgi:hypothetical protein